MAADTSKATNADINKIENLISRTKECLKILRLLNVFKLQSNAKSDPPNISVFINGKQNSDASSKLIIFLENKSKLESFFKDFEQWFKNNPKALEHLETPKSRVRNVSSESRWEDVDKKISEEPGDQYKPSSKQNESPVSKTRIPEPGKSTIKRRKSFTKFMSKKLGKVVGTKQDLAKAKDTNETTAFETPKPSKKQANESTKSSAYKSTDKRIVPASTISTRDVLVQELMSCLDTPVREEELFRALTARNAELIDRLASEMNSKVSANESALENIGIRNRPTNVADEYRLLMSRSWLEAKCALDYVHPEDEGRKLGLLRYIIMVASSQAIVTYKEVMDTVTCSLNDPLECYTTRPDDTTERPEKKTHRDSRNEIEPPRQSHDASLSMALQNNIGDHFRLTADSVQLNSLFQNTAESVTHTYKRSNWEQIKRDLIIPEVSEFVEECARLAWKMVLQRPPMLFTDDDVKTEWSEQKHLELAWGSKPKRSGAIIRYYRYPCLYHGDKCMVKGMVYVD